MNHQFVLNGLSLECFLLYLKNMTMCVMDCKSKGDFVVREHYISSEEPSNEFASAEVFNIFLGKSVKPKCSHLALLG